MIHFRRITENVSHFNEYIQFTTVEPDVLVRVGQFAYNKIAIACDN